MMARMPRRTLVLTSGTFIRFPSTEESMMNFRPGNGGLEELGVGSLPVFLDESVGVEVLGQDEDARFQPFSKQSGTARKAAVRPAGSPS